MFDISRIYSLIPDVPEGDVTLLLRGSHEAAQHAERLGLPRALIESIRREVRSREAAKDLEDFPLGVAIMCLEAAMEAGLNLLDEDEHACHLSLIAHAPNAALALIGCGATGTQVRDMLSRAVEGGRLKAA
jgi:hypothetical protein